MAKADVSADLAAEHRFPGLLGIRRDGAAVIVELDLPQQRDRIDQRLVPGVEALVIGFLKRLVHQARAPRQHQTVAVSRDYVLARLRPDDLDHFLISLAALFNGADTPADQTGKPA
jgi:hypothetical protein